MDNMVEKTLKVSNDSPVANQAWEKSVDPAVLPQDVV